jgi:hypothetical protein
MRRLPERLAGRRATFEFFRLTGGAQVAGALVVLRRCSRPARGTIRSDRWAK